MELLVLCLLSKNFFFVIRRLGITKNLELSDSSLGDAEINKVACILVVLLLQMFIWPRLILVLVLLIKCYFTVSWFSYLDR